MSSSAGKAGVPFSGTYTGSKHGDLHKFPHQRVQPCTDTLSLFVLRRWAPASLSACSVLDPHSQGVIKRNTAGLTASSSHSWFPIAIVHLYIYALHLFQFTGGGRHRNPWSEFWRINEIHGQKDDRWEVRYEAVFAQNNLWRCAELSLVSIVNKLPESWICFRPVLPLMYASQYLPGISKWVSLSFFNKYSSVLLNLPCCAARVVMSVLGPAFLARVRDSRNAMESEKLK